MNGQTQPTTTQPTTAKPSTGSSVKLSVSSKSIFTGNRFAITATASGSVSWSSSNTGVATVVSRGTLSTIATQVNRYTPDVYDVGGYGKNDLTSDAGMFLAGNSAMGASWWLALAGAFAFALASYNIIIIEAGHIVKGYVIGYMPVTLAGMTLLFKRKYLWGAILFLLGVALSISNNHIQITYYLFLLCLFIYMGYLVAKVKAKEFAELGKVTAIMAVCAIVAVLPGAKTLYSNWELGEHSIRGESELTPKPNAAGVVEKKSSGLDKDYAFAWSYGKALKGIYGLRSSLRNMAHQLNIYHIQGKSALLISRIK